MKALYNKVTERLTSVGAKAAYDENNTANCKYIDLYRGQYLDWENYDTFPTPAVFFEFSVSHDRKKSTATVTFHLCYEQKRDSSSIGRSRDKALAFFDYINVTHALLDCLESEETGKLSLIAEETVKQGNVVDVHTLTYECSYNRTAVVIEPKYTYVEGEDVELDGGLVTPPPKID